MDPRDPFYAYLAREVLPIMGVDVRCPEFDVCVLSEHGSVYCYRERTSHKRLVAKFFGDRDALSWAQRQRLLNTEYENLWGLRSIGFADGPNRVVRPLTRNEGLNCVLVEEEVAGKDLDHYIVRAAHERQQNQLFRKLTKLAGFLADLHNRTASEASGVDFGPALAKTRKTVGQLVQMGVMHDVHQRNLESLLGEWRRKGEMWADCEVTVHGDATPTNFFFPPHDGVTAIDLEHARRADRSYDVGMIAGELKHHFAWRVGCAGDAEPFIGHFLWEYCGHFPNRDAAFTAVTQRMRFYMALAELRIARNGWLSWGHRKWLVDEAERCLR